MKRAFLFDIGNVLVHFDFREAAQKFAQLSAATADEILTLLSPFKDDLESGRMSDADFITQSISRIGFRGTHEEFTRIWGDIFTENPPMLKLVRDLAGTLPLYLFSNTSGLHKEWLFKQFNIFSLFDDGIYSYEAGSAKPREEFYHEAIRRFGLTPSQTIYIDDLNENIATGQRLGFVCHHYQAAQHDRLEAEVEKWIVENRPQAAT
ncbi:MAG: HAD family phosphatase [Verrucomicrobiaceae bacterium]